MLGALMRSQGRLYAFDITEKRLANLKLRLKRSGLSNVHPQLISSERDTKVKRLAGKIDRVLVDAPCTGFGTLRRNPDLKWRQSATGPAELAVKQRAILAAAATMVKPGGRLVYATCSVLPEENEAIVDEFLAHHPGFAPGDAAAELARAGIALAGDELRMHVRQARALEPQFELRQPLVDDVVGVDPALRAHQRAEQERLAAGAGAEIRDHVGAPGRNEIAGELAALILHFDRAFQEQRMAGEHRPSGDAQSER